MIMRSGIENTRLDVPLHDHVTMFEHKETFEQGLFHLETQDALPERHSEA